MLLLASPSLAEPYSWPVNVPQSLLAPTDRSGEGIVGGALQGGLIDLRWGQASVDVAGVGIVLQFDGNSKFTLNGAKSSAKELADKIKSGQSLAAAVRYDPESGRIGWLDALGSPSNRAIEMSRIRWSRDGSRGTTYRVPRSELVRLNLNPAHLFIPGVSHRLSGRIVEGAWETRVPDLAQWEWKNVPVYLTGHDGDMYRGQVYSYSGLGPKISDCGPKVASAALSTLPCWVELEQRSVLLDLKKTKIKVTPTGNISDLQLRGNRLHFYLKPGETGRHTISVTLVDQQNRQAKATWSLNLKPE